MFMYGIEEDYFDWATNELLHFYLRVESLSYFYFVARIRASWSIRWKCIRLELWATWFVLVLWFYDSACSIAGEMLSVSMLV